jgi:hypothetical protein
MADWHPTTALALAVYAAGFEYDRSQDIITSRMWAWQRATGYTWGYDVAAPAMRMIIDCEPFYFSYDRKVWMIELWKGQYGLETGAEIGVYNVLDPAALPDRDPLPTLSHGVALRGNTALPYATVQRATVSAQRWCADPKHVFFACARPDEMPTMSFVLSRNGNELFRRPATAHWWLTGFKWGVFTSRTSELVLDAEIELLSPMMCSRFMDALAAKQYRFSQRGPRKVRFTFDRPWTAQPNARTQNERDVQAGNERLVAGYVTLRESMKLPNNDPNGFDMRPYGMDALQKIVHDVEDKAAKLRSDAAGALKKLKNVAPAVAKKAHDQVSEAAKRLESTLSNEATAAYRDIASRFEKKEWRCSARA